MQAHSNAHAIVAEVTAAVAGLDDIVRREVTHHAALLETEVKRNASGRPGPNVRTGDYRRSITRTRLSDTTMAVGTNAAQGRRLEFGFVGVDSLGRTYDQPPFPHFGPAVDVIGPKLLESLGDKVEKLL